MARCAQCGAEVGMPYTCNECGVSLCTDHRLPEQHQCGVPESSAWTPGDSTPSDAAEREGGILDTALTALLLPLVLLWMGLRAALALLTNWIVLILAAVVLVAAVVTGAVAVPMPGVDELIPADNSTSDGSTSMSTSAPAPGLDESAVQSAFIDRLNAARSERDLGPVHAGSRIRTVGEGHAFNMAANDYLGHIQPDGDDVGDRFSQKGLSCRVPIEESDRYYTGLENVATWYMNERVNVEWQDASYVATTEQELAYALFKQWMSSPGHRDAMLTPGIKTVGLGLAETESGKIYAALEMC